MPRFNKLNSIIAFEGGDPTIRQVLVLFSNLIRTGQAWTLQGFYGRTAANLIDNGLIAKNGDIQWKALKDKGIDPKAKWYGGE